MAQPLPTFAQELTLAVQGSWRLLIGRRDVGQYYAEDLRGLATSFIALIGSVVITFAMSAMLNAGAPTEISSFSLLVQNALLYGGITLASWVVLRLTSKTDRFVPYLVVENWINAILSVLLAILALVTRSGELVVFVALIAGLVARINNARLIVGLGIAQIVMLIIVQSIGLMIALLIAGAIFGPEAAPQI